MSQPGEHLYQMQPGERVETQQEKEAKAARQGRARMSSTLSDAAEEWKRRQKLKAKKVMRPSPVSTGSFDSNGEAVPSADGESKPAKSIPGYMSSTKASRSNRYSTGEIIEDSDKLDSPKVVRDSTPSSNIKKTSSFKEESSSSSPSTPKPGLFQSMSKSFREKLSRTDSGKAPPPPPPRQTSSPTSPTSKIPTPSSDSPPPYRSSSPRSTRPRTSSFKEPDSPASSNLKEPPSPRSPRATSPRTTTPKKAAGTWSKTPMWAQQRARTQSTSGIPGTNYSERQSSGASTSGGARVGARSNSEKDRKSRARSTSPRAGARGNSSPRAGSATSPPKTNRGTSSPRHHNIRDNSPRSTSTNRAGRRSSSFIPGSGGGAKKGGGGGGNSAVSLRPIRLFTTEDHMPVKCARVAVEYLRVWLLLSGATPKAWRGSRLARKVIDESSVYQDSSSTHARYRKLMRLVHPDSLVSLKGEEPTSALTLAMAGGLLRTYNAANEILEHAEKANDHAASACLVSPGDFPPGGHPSARTRNKSMALHLFITAEKMAADPNLLHSNQKAGKRLLQSLEALRQVSEEHRSGVIGDMLKEEEKRVEDEKKAAKAAAKKAELEAANEKAFKKDTAEDVSDKH